MRDDSRLSPARGLSRRALLRAAAGAVTAVAAGPFVFTPARAQGFNWKRFQGKELFLLLTKHPWIDVLEKNIPEFESLSGMKVKWETLPEIQARQKLTVEMTGGSSGGAWIRLFQTYVGSNQFNGLNSYKYTAPARPLEMFGAYIDDVIIDSLLRSVATAPPAP